MKPASSTGSRRRGNETRGNPAARGNSVGLKLRSGMLFLKKTYVFLMPVLFAVYAVLAFFSNNVQEVRFSEIKWILVAAVFLAGLVTGGFYLFFRDRSKASLIATCWMIIIFSYGQVYTVVHKSLGASVGRNVIPVAAGACFDAALAGLDLEMGAGAIQVGLVFWLDGCHFARHDFLFVGALLYYSGFEQTGPPGSRPAACQSLRRPQHLLHHPGCARA